VFLTHYDDVVAVLSEFSLRSKAGQTSGQAHIISHHHVKAAPL
jgi:hypothetical protein